MTESLMGYESKIVPELQTLARPIEDATPHPKNIRKHKIEKIAASLETHGQRAPIVVQASTGLIVKGNGTHTAAQLLGWTETAQSWQEMDDIQAMAFLLEDNKTSDQSAYDKKKTIEVLGELMAGPGLDAFGGWSLEEFIDLQEEEEGVKTLDPTTSDATFATKDGGEIKHERAALPGEKMREVPLVLTVADHAMFVARVQSLQKVFGTAGSIATIVEAVRRQSEWEASGQNVSGKAVTDDEAYTIKREVVKELRDYFLTTADKSHTGAQIAAILERTVPYRDTAETLAPVAAGQTELFPVLEGVTVITADGTTTGTVNSDDSITVTQTPEEYEAEQAEALRRYRAAQPK